MKKSCTTTVLGIIPQHHAVN